MRKFLIVFTLFIAIGAAGGAIMMWVDPSGNGRGGAPMLMKRHPLASWAVLVCGVILMLWIALEWWVWGVNPISNLYFVFGLVEVGAAVYTLRKAEL